MYISMVAGKTSALSRMAAKMACTLCDGNVDLITEKAVVQFAESIGVAFQVTKLNW
jgi:geranylgeranyl pyrophosphate synthase